MLESCLTPYRFCNRYLALQLDSIDPSQADHIPHPGVKPPRWIVGHIGMGVAGIGQMLGQSVCPDYQPEWLPYYGPGSDSTATPDNAPSLATLREVILNCEQTVVDAVSAANEEDFQDDHGIDILKTTPFQTKAQLIAHLLTTHYSTHLGELAIWRRVMGQAPLF